MLSAVITSRHSYPAVLLAEQQVDQRSVHPGPLVVSHTLPVFGRCIHPLFLGAQTISSPVLHESDEGGGMLPTEAVARWGAIRLSASLTRRWFTPVSSRYGVKPNCVSSALRVRFRCAE